MTNLGGLEVQYKKKFVKAEQHQCGTGGGPSSHITLSSVEERLIAFLGPAVEGDTTPEAGLPAPEIIFQEIMLEDVAVDLQLEEFSTVEEPEISPGPSAAKKRKGEILMSGFVDVEERRFQLDERRLCLEQRRADMEEKKAEFEEMKVAAFESQAKSMEEGLNTRENCCLLCTLLPHP